MRFDMNSLEVDVGCKKARRMLATPLHPPVWGIAYSSKRFVQQPHQVKAYYFFMSLYSVQLSYFFPFPTTKPGKSGRLGKSG